MLTLNGYLTNLASEAPAPGGGSAAMVVAAAGCSLAAMVARICAGSRKYEAVRDRALAIAADADDLRGHLMQLREQDEAAFAAVVAARGDRPAMQIALREAAAVPLDGARAGLRVVELAQAAFSLGNAHLASDAGCAAEFGYAAMRACAYNVRINHKYMDDADLIRTQAAELDGLERDAVAKLEAIRSKMAQA